MKVLLIIFISIFYFCFSKALINKFGKVYIRDETKSQVISINATNFQMNETINIIVKAIRGDVNEYIYYKFMSEVEMYRSPLQIYVNANYKKTPVKTEISDDTKTYYYEIVKNKNEECLAINVLNFLKNDNSAYLIIESASGSSNSYVIAFIIFIIYYCICTFRSSNFRFNSLCLLL